MPLCVCVCVCVYADLSAGVLHTKTSTRVLNKHVVLSERARIEKQLYSLTSRQLSLQSEYTIMIAYLTHEVLQQSLTDWCCFSNRFSPPPSSALFLFSSSISADLAVE